MLDMVMSKEVLGKQFTVYGTKEEPLFLAKDVKEWIEHNNITHMMNTVDEDEKLTYTICNSGQNREMWFLTEDGLYEVLMQSRKPIAKQFKKEVKAILKEIRQTGVYITENATNEDIVMASKFGSRRTHNTFAECDALSMPNLLEEFTTYCKKLDSASRLSAYKSALGGINKAKEKISGSTIHLLPILLDTEKQLIVMKSKLENKVAGGKLASKTKKIASLENEVNSLEEELEDKLAELEKAVKKVPIEEYMCCNSHPFSANYMFTWENGKCRKTNAYRKWIDGFDYKGLVSVADMWDKVDFTKPITIRLQFILKKEFDVDNGIKSIIDLLQDRYSFNDNIVANVLTAKRGFCDTYEEGKIYIHIENVEG